MDFHVFDIIDIATYIPIGILGIALLWLFNKEMKKSSIREHLEAQLEDQTQKLKENRIARMNELSKAAEFGRLSQGLFHDLMTPLTSVMLHTEQLKNKETTEALERMTSYVKDIRSTLAREESERMTNINEELATVLHILNYQLKKERIKLELKVDEIPAFFGNPLKIRQIFSNLISNSIDSFEENGNQLRHIAISISERAGHIEISVEDTGSGIAPENIKKIFDPFFTTKSYERGTGIGLTTVKTIVEKDFKGTLEVSSILGKGTIFKIEFPKILTKEFIL